MPSLHNDLSELLKGLVGFPTELNLKFLRIGRSINEAKKGKTELQGND